MSNYSYEPHDWFNEELITEENMDYIENGIANAYSWLGELETSVNNVGEDIDDLEATVSAITGQIPTNISDLNNDSNFITLSDVTTAGFIKIADVASNGFIKIADVASNGFVKLGNTSTTAAAGDHTHGSTYTTPAQVDQKIADALANIPIADNTVYSAT